MFIAPATRLTVLKWHRWVTLALMIQLGIWIVTAFVMTMIERSSLTSYAPPQPALVDAVSAWPDLDILKAQATADTYTVRLDQPGLRPRVTLDDGEGFSPEALSALSDLAFERFATLASEMTGEDIQAGQISLKTHNSVEYQKLPVPAVRVEAEKATLFFDPKTGEYYTQTNRIRFIENLAKTIHVMDYTGKGEFRANWVLTFFALLFLNAAILGVLAVKKIYLRKKPIPTRMKIHQILGLVLAVQVFFWVSSGLGVVWLLHPLRDAGHAILADSKTALDWDRVRIHPTEIYNPVDGAGDPATITLTMVNDGPAYQVQWSGRNPQQALWSAETGEDITLNETSRDQIAQTVLVPEAYASIKRWEVAESPRDLDFYFYTGPYPVWKAYFDDPTGGAVAIDQVTGHVHAPRTGNEIFLERYYNVHVVNWRLRVIQYRREPLLLIVIGLVFALLVSGAMIQWRRYKTTGKL